MIVHSPYAMLYSSCMEQNDKQEILEAIGVFADAVDKRFESMESSIDKRFDKLEIKVISLEEDFKMFRKDFAETQKQISQLFTKIDEFITIMKRNEEEVVALRAGLERAEARITALEKKLQMA